MLERLGWGAHHEERSALSRVAHVDLALLHSVPSVGIFHLDRDPVAREAYEQVHWLTHDPDISADLLQRRDNLGLVRVYAASEARGSSVAVPVDCRYRLRFTRVELGGEARSRCDGQVPGVLIDGWLGQ